METQRRGGGGGCVVVPARAMGRTWWLGVSQAGQLEAKGPALAAAPLRRALRWTEPGRTALSTRSRASAAEAARALLSWPSGGQTFSGGWPYLSALQQSLFSHSRITLLDDAQGSMPIGPFSAAALSLYKFSEL